MATTQEGSSFGLRWTSTTQPGLLTIALSGELDLASAPALEDVLRAAVDASPVVVLDLETLEFMDSTGLRLLGRTQQACEREGKRFLLGRASHQARRVLHLAGLVDYFEYVEGAPAPEQLCRACDNWVPADATSCAFCGSALASD